MKFSIGGKYKMNKILLGSAAIAGLLLASAPAQAQMELTIGGHSKNYVGWLDQDESSVAGAPEVNEFDMVRETELHFNGESTLDNGLTFGFQVEAEVDGGDDANTLEESYIYMSGGWGRLNLGSEDGAAYLLQVSAPSADSNIDGIRQYIQPVNYGAAFFAGVDADANGIDDGVEAVAGANFDYAQDQTGYAEKITYLTPNYNGFQLGASFTPDAGDDQSNSGLNGFATDTEGENDDVYEVAARYEGVMSNFGYAAGAGYIKADSADAWNVGLDVDAGPFGIGAVYTDADARLAPAAALGGGDTEQIVVGVDYTTGPFKFGASYFNEDADNFIETDRYTGGVIYTAGPGLSFRGSVSQIEHDVTAGDDIDATSVLGGVQINF